MNAINNAVKYGLENLKTVQEALSLGLNSNQIDKPTIAAPKTVAVIT